MIEKSSRIQRRAEYEIGVVRACKTKYDDKIDNIKQDRDGLIAAIAVLKEKVLQASDVEVKRDCAREIAQKQGDLKKAMQLLESFRSTSGVLAKLLSLLKSFYDQELYKFIVDNIPERKLPKMVRNPNKVDQVYALANNLLKEFNKQMERILIVSRRSAEEEKHIENNDEIIRAQIGTDVDDIDKLIANIESEVAVEAVNVEETSGTVEESTASNEIKNINS